MKRIGIIGGLSAESTTHFYNALTRRYIHLYGNADYPEIVLFSVRFDTFMAWAKQGEWDKFADGLLEGIRVLEAGNVDFGLIAANMPHIVFDKVQSKTSLPLLHMADTVASEVHQRGIHTVGLIGTEATMQASFYQDRLRAFGIECLVPTPDEQKVIQEVLDTELFRGTVTAESEEKYVKIIQSLKERHADAVILGCTEIPLLISDTNSPIPTFDSTQIFVNATLSEALSD